MARGEPKKRERKFRFTTARRGLPIVPSPLHDRRFGLDERGEGATEGPIGGTWLRGKLPESYVDPKRKILLINFRHPTYLRLASAEREPPRLWTSFIQVPKPDKVKDSPHHVLRLRGANRDRIYRINLKERITMRRPGLVTPARIPHIEEGTPYKDGLGNRRYRYRTLNRADEAHSLLRLHTDISQEALQHLNQFPESRKTPQIKELEQLLKGHVSESPSWFSQKKRDTKQRELF